ncbi:MAG: ComEC/Rec2 family competence protein [Bdellovibrio sp.]|jgi:ComEC/Rec2-related protein
MSTFALLLSSHALPDSLNLLKLLAGFAQSMHEICLIKLSSSAHYDVNAALFCGKSPTSHELRLLYIESGLFHLLVVSGSHLTFLEMALRKILGARLAKVLIPPVLLVFAFMSNWQPPVVRAFFEWAMRPALRSRQSRQSTERRVLESWLWCLALQPQWILSSSLHLSVAARIALVPKVKNEVIRALVILIFLAPLLAGWTVSSPWLAVISLLLAPASLTLWFAIGVTELFYPAGWSVLTEMNRVWDLILLQVGTLVPSVQKLSLGTRLWSPLYVAALLIMAHLWRVRQQRRWHRP